MPTLRETVAARVAEALRAAQAAGELPAFDLPELGLERPKKPEWGDYSLATMGLAKPARQAPLKVAEIVARHFTPGEGILAPQVAPPGYLNFTLDAAWVARQVPAMLVAGEAWGNVELGHGRRAQVEYVSANPTGPLHVGRVRGAVIGDTLANVMAACGWQVTREYYFNDAGRQVQNLGESLRLRYLQALGHYIAFPQNKDLYEGEYLVELGRQVAEEHGEALLEAEGAVFEKIAKQAMFASIQATLARLNIHMDVFFNEVSLYESGALQAYLDALRTAGYVYEQDGAVWLRYTALGGDKDKVLVKSEDGLPTYRLPDMAYHKNKLVERDFDLVVDVLGSDHKEEWKEVMAGLRALDVPAERVRLLMHQFITFKGGKMSTRKGRIVTVDDLLDEVGPDAARYFILQRAPESHLEFDLDLAVKQSSENPVYYIQYAHTRTAAILRKAQAGHGLNAEGGDPACLTHPKELAFIRRALELEDTLVTAATRLEPHHLAYYAYDLARALHAFYDDPECRVLPGDPPVPPELVRARLTFVRAAKGVLGKVLRLMGMSTPESM